MTLAAILALLIGGSLGLLGGGGSILTVPIFVYVMGLDSKVAIATSLLVVGITSAAAAIQHARAGNVRWKIALTFSAAGMLGAFFGGRAAQYVADSVLLTLFAALMLAAAAAMWRGRKSAAPQDGGHRFSPWLIAAEGIAVGFLTGLVGAGGGFMVVPALALLSGLPMAQAIGSSLVVISFKSFAGFAGYASHVTVDYELAAVVSTFAVVGTFGGTYVAKRLPQDTLRRGFALFVLVLGVYVLYRELPIELLFGFSASSLLPFVLGSGAIALGIILFVKIRKSRALA